MNSNMDICIDFDGTCVTHEFPEVGRDIGAAPVLRELVKQGHNLILFTMRSNLTEKPIVSGEGLLEVPIRNYLDEAVDWFKRNSISLYGINRNPTQDSWTSSPKAYGHLYIDDAALGTPLIHGKSSQRPFVDWVDILMMLIISGTIGTSDREEKEIIDRIKEQLSKN